MNKLTIRSFALIVALLAATPVLALDHVDGTLTALGSRVTLPLTGFQGASITIRAGCNCEVTAVFSYDNGVSFSSDYTNPPFNLPLVGNSASGSLSLPGNPSHVRAILTRWTSGSTSVTLRGTTTRGISRATATGVLSAATADGTSATGNFVALPIDPTRWASATLSFSSGAFTGTLIWDAMVNGQWVPAPYAVLTSTASANPSTAASVAYAGAAADTWDLPLPGNITAVRARCSAFASGSVVATLTPGRSHVPGVPVTATLFDILSAGAAISQSPELSGWDSTRLTLIIPVGGAAQYQNRDSTGAALLNINTWAASSAGIASSSRGSALGNAYAVSGNANWNIPWIERPLYLGTAVAGTRMILEVSR